MLEKMKKLSKRTKVILLVSGLILIAGIGSVITACTVTKSDDGNDKENIVVTESITEPTEQATGEATELPTEDETEKATEKATEETTEEATEKPTEKKDKSDSDKDEDKEKENDKEEATVVITTTTTGGGNNDNNSNNNSSNNTSTGNTTTNNNTQTNTNNNTTTNNTSNTTNKVWHDAEYKTVHHEAETKKVWVVDQEGYTYEEPVYEELPLTICYTCGAEITGNTSSHGKSHMLAGENFSYGIEPRTTQTGTKTITVEEVGHWETQVVKEAWDEQVLVREAGYY